MTDLAITQSGDVHVFCLSRADIGNSLSTSLVEALHDGIDAFEAGRGRVMRGSGRHFCTGFDLSDLDETTDGELLLRFVRIEQLLARLWAAPYPTIAEVQGRATGAGADLATACWRRIAQEGSRFSFPGAAFGLVLGTRRLASRIGEQAALDIIAAGKTLDAPAAESCGLVSRVVAKEEMDAARDEEIALARRLEPTAFAAISGAARSELAGLDMDMAALVRSAARPGIRDRIAAYRAGTQVARPIRAD